MKVVRNDSHDDEVAATIKSRSEPLKAPVKSEEEVGGGTELLWTRTNPIVCCVPVELLVSMFLIISVGRNEQGEDTGGAKGAVSVEAGMICQTREGTFVGICPTLSDQFGDNWSSHGEIQDNWVLKRTLVRFDYPRPKLGSLGARKKDENFLAKRLKKV